RTGEPGRPGAEAFPPAKAIAVLLAYVPFADDDSVEDEVLGALSVLSVRGERTDPQFAAALADPLAPRRAAAGYVLGRAGTPDQPREVRRLLDDPAPEVRFRAAQGLLAAGDRAAVPVLIDLLGKAPDAWRWRVEEALQRLAAGRAPQLPPGDSPGGP